MAVCSPTVLGGATGRAVISRGGYLVCHGVSIDQSVLKWMLSGYHIDYSVAHFRSPIASGRGARFRQNNYDMGIAGGCEICTVTAEMCAEIRRVLRCAWNDLRAVRAD